MSRFSPSLCMYVPCSVYFLSANYRLFLALKRKLFSFRALCGRTSRLSHQGLYYMGIERGQTRKTSSSSSSSPLPSTLHCSITTANIESVRGYTCSEGTISNSGKRPRPGHTIKPFRRASHQEIIKRQQHTIFFSSIAERGLPWTDDERSTDFLDSKWLGFIFQFPLQSGKPKLPNYGNTTPSNEM